MMRYISSIFVFICLSSVYANESKSLDLGTNTVESNVRQPPTQVTENPNQILITAKVVLKNDFTDFEKQILEELKKSK